MSTIQEIKQKLSCREYLSQHGIHVKNKGRCISPLRSDATNPSSFYVEDDHWYDFGSGSGGDVIDLAAQMEYNGDVGTAIRELSLTLGLRSDDKNYQTWREDIQRLCNRAAAYHSALLPSDYDYLAARGITSEDADRLMIGRVTDGYLKGRLFLPYFKNGAVVYYATRAMPDGARPESKYMKASLSECDSYQHVPWGLQTLSRRSDILIISEGYFDAISWEREGYAVISPITGNFSSSQWPDVISACRMFSRVCIIFDNDEISHAGEHFTERAALKLLQSRIPFVVGHTPVGIKDVNDYYTNGGDLARLVESAVDGLKFMAERCKNADELQQFILSINRYTSKAAIADLVSTLNYPDSVKKAIIKVANSAPDESQIIKEVLKDHDLIFIEADGFYEWNGVIWEKLSDYVIEKYIGDAYGKNFSTGTRKTQTRKNMQSECFTKVEFNKLPVMTFKNGTLELNTGGFRPHSRADYCSFALDYHYDKNATCPRWRKFIDECTDDDPKRKDVLQTLMGYVMFPDCRFQKIFMLMGKGGNGKSVYLDIMKEVYGENSCSNITPTQMSDNFQRIFLKDSLVNYATEIKGDVSSSMDWLKKISCGEVINGSYKGKDNIRFATRSKLIFACNSVPSASVVEGLDRRMVFIDFPCSFVEFPDPNDPMQRQADTELLHKLHDELPGILNWAYEGYKLLDTVKYFTETDEQADYLDQFKQASNPVATFCEDYADSLKGEITRSELYSWYEPWCDRTGHKQLPTTKFFPAFRSAMGHKCEEVKKRVDGKTTRVFIF